MIKVDDLVESRPEEIALSGLPTFFRPHESPRSRPQAARESRPARRINLQENLSTTAETRQIGLLRTARKLQPIRGLGVLHGRLLWTRLSRVAVRFEPSEWARKWQPGGSTCATELRTSGPGQAP